MGGAAAMAFTGLALSLALPSVAASPPAGYRARPVAVPCKEGFIHLSGAHQLEATHRRFYADLDHVVLLTVDPHRCRAIS